MLNKAELKNLFASAACGLLALSAEVTAQDTASPAVFTAAQAAAGKVEYQNDCHNCHTDKLTGRVGDPGELPALSSLDAGAQKMIQQNGGNVPALAGAKFLAR